MQFPISSDEFIRILIFRILNVKFKSLEFGWIQHIRANLIEFDHFKAIFGQINLIDSVCTQQDVIFESE